MLACMNSFLHWFLPHTCWSTVLAGTQTVMPPALLHQVPPPDLFPPLPAGASGAACSKRGREQPSPLPAGLGGSCLPSPRFAKRLRTSFDVGASRGAATGGVAEVAMAAGGLTSPCAGYRSAAAATAAARQTAGGLAQLLEPSPEAAVAAVKPGGAAGGMERQSSNNENALGNVRLR